MPLTFRSARRDDVPAIVDIYARAHVEGNLHVPSSQQIGEWIDDAKSHTFVALEGTWRDGYRREDGTYADLCAYGLLESDRRTGAA